MKRCPFCGGEAELFKTHENQFGIIHENGECPIDLQSFQGNLVYDTKEEAITAWNTRRPVERILERLKELYKYNAEQADIYKDGNGDYMREMKEMYMDKANCYGVAMRTVEEEMKVVTE